MTLFSNVIIIVINDSFLNEYFSIKACDNILLGLLYISKYFFDKIFSDSSSFFNSLKGNNSLGFEYIVNKHNLLISNILIFFD